MIELKCMKMNNFMITWLIWDCFQRNSNFWESQMRIVRSSFSRKSCKWLEILLMIWIKVRSLENRKVPKSYLKKKSNSKRSKKKLKNIWIVSERNQLRQEKWNQLGNSQNKSHSKKISSFYRLQTIEAPMEVIPKNWNRSNNLILQVIRLNSQMVEGIRYEEQSYQYKKMEWTVPSPNLSFPTLPIPNYRK